MCFKSEKNRICQGTRVVSTKQYLSRIAAWSEISASGLEE